MVSFVLSDVLLLFLLGSVVFAEPVEDKRALMQFVSLVPHTHVLNWNPFTSACDFWEGVTCSGDRSRVTALRLPAVGFYGRIPRNTISRLTALQALSLRSNSLTGTFPSELSKLGSLTELHLQFNNFSGPLPSDFSSWKNLTAIDLSSNFFTGNIPPSISDLEQLSALDLSNNSLSGSIPELQLPNILFLNLSYNHLEGTIPKSLLNFPNSAFVGNNLTRASTLPGPDPLTPGDSSPNSTTVRKKLTHSVILGAVLAGCAIVFVALVVFFLVFCSKRRKRLSVSGKRTKGGISAEKALSTNQDENNGLVFFEGCSYAFDLEDLLRASAEVLGKGTYGTAYKAVMEDSTMVVVKRLKDVGVGRREFEQQMEAVGRIRHENVVNLRAYYYSKDEKLMVYEYYTLGSVSSVLHGKRGEDRIPLDWETRVKIALGAARGIEHIHTENGGKLVHGNIRSSNIFLNHQLHGCVADLGIATLVNSTAPRTAGHRAPEVTDTRKATQMADVYSFGMVLLELLTGKSPVQVTGGGDEVVHLVRWVQSVVREEWTGEVFDVELMRYANIEEEMVEMLQIAMACIARIPDQRPKIAEVVRMIADVRRMDAEMLPSSEESCSLTPPPERGSSSNPVGK